MKTLPGRCLDAWGKAYADWTLWSSYGSARSVEAQAAQLELLQSIHLSSSALMGLQFTPVDQLCPFAREVTLGPEPVWPGV